METVSCPVLKGQVNGTICLEIVLVTDREANHSVLPSSIKWTEEMREICKACKYHDDVET